MEAKDQRLDLIQSFTVNSFRLDPDLWREFVSEDKNQAIFNSFFKSHVFQNLFISWEPGAGLCISFHFPLNVQTKVLCVSKSSPEGLTEENIRENLTIQEIYRGDLMSFTVFLYQQVACPLLGNPESSQSWAAGEAEESRRILERQKSRTQVIRAQIEGVTFLPHPEGTCADCLHGDSGMRKLLSTCSATVNEWAGLVSEVLKQDPPEAELTELEPNPLEQFTFWENRLKNLLSLQQQLQSSRAQQVYSMVQQADHLLWSKLLHMCREVEEGLREAEEVTTALKPLKERLEQVEHSEFQELVSSVVDLVDQFHQVQVQSQYYRDPDRLFVLLTQICNTYIQRSRKFLRGEEVMRGLVSDPSLVLDDVRPVILTLQALREGLSKDQNQVQDNYSDLETLLRNLHSIQEVLSLTLQLSLLDQVVLSGGSGGMWTDVVQDVHQDFLCHLKVLSESPCDPMDPKDQSLQLFMDQFMVQVSNQETRLGSVLSRALEDCCKSSSSTAQLLEMFWFLLDRPLIRDKLSLKLKQLVELVLVELDQIGNLVQSQRRDPKPFSRSMSHAAGQILWTRQLRLRAEDSLNSYRTVQDLLGVSGESQEVLQKFQAVVDLLQVFRDQVRSDWISQLDWDCGLILDQAVIQQTAHGLLEVGCSLQLCPALKDLRCVSKESKFQLPPQAALLLTCSHDITQSYLVLSHMVSCYNQVLSDALQVELPLIQDQLQDLDQYLSELQGNTWTCEGLKQLVQQHKDRVLIVHSTVSKARANMDAMTHIIQGWAELHLLQCSGDSQLRGGANDQVQGQVQEDGQELLRLIQVNRSLYGAEESSESWIRYLDHVDDRVQTGLLQMLIRTLHQLCDRMKPQSSSGVLMVTCLTVQEADCVFEPSVGGGLSDHLRSIITDVYRAANELPRISVSRHGDYQVCVQQLPALTELEQEVMHHLQQVEQEAEHLRASLDRYSYLLESDRTELMEEFLRYGRQLDPEELEAEVTPPTLNDYRREIESLSTLSKELTHLDDFILLHGWLQVDLRPFRESMLTTISDLTHLYTKHLLSSLTHSLQQVGLCAVAEEDSSPPSGSALMDSVILLEAAGVQLPDHLTTQLQQTHLCSQSEPEPADRDQQLHHLSSS